MSRLRDFNPTVLDLYYSTRLRVGWKPGSQFIGKARLFVIFLPRLLLTGAGQEIICTARDENFLRSLSERHFGGCTASQSFLEGIWQRGELPETNIHRQLIVLANPWRGTIRYFQALRKELEECSGEEQILIVRQKLFIV